MLAIPGEKRTRRSRGAYRKSIASVECEPLEGRQLLSRGLGLMGFGGGWGGRAMMAELGPFGGGGRDAMFGGGSFGLRGGMKNPIFLLTSSLLYAESGSPTPLSRSVLSTSAVQSAFQTLQSDYNYDVSVGAQPTHVAVGQLQDDLLAIHKGTLTGSSATAAIQNDEAAILASLGLSTGQVSQIQADLQALQNAIQSGSSGVANGSTGSNTATTPAPTGSDTTTATTSTESTGTGTTTSTGATITTSTAPSAVPSISSSPPATAVQAAFQTLQTDLKNDLPSGAQATNATIGQVEDDLNAISQGTLTGSQAVTTLQADTASVWKSMGLTPAQISQIQADQAAVETAIQANAGSATGSTSATSSGTSASPTSIASVEATMQSVQQDLVGLPGLGPTVVRVDSGGTLGGGSGIAIGPGGGNGMGVGGGQIGILRGGPAGIGGSGASGGSAGGGPVRILRGGPAGSGGPGASGGSASSGSGPVGGSGASGGPIMIYRGSMDIGGGTAAGGSPVMITNPGPGGGGGSATVGSAPAMTSGPIFVQSANAASSAASVPAVAGGFAMSGGRFGTMGVGWR